MTYSLTEPQPHPQLQARGKPGGGYMRIGRGGAGNFVKPSAATKPQPPAQAQQASTTPALPRPAPGDASSHHHSAATEAKYTSGRGGIGNAHTGERPMFFFDEELERIYSREGRTPPVYHIGRAGFGNRVGSVSSEAASSTVADAAAAADGGVGAAADGYYNTMVPRAEEVRMSEESRRSWATGSSDGRRRSSVADRAEHQHHGGGGVWARLSHTFSRGS